MWRSLLTDGARLYRWHLFLFLSINALLNVVNYWQGAPWWALWPVLTWGLFFSVHFFWYKAISVDEEWVDERVQDLQMNSCDFGHIKDIEERIARGDRSVTPRVDGRGG